jgi:hypothetical protein
MLICIILTLIMIFMIFFLWQEMCPMQVFDIEDMGGKGKEDRAVVARPRDCTMCRYVKLTSLPFPPCTHHLVSRIRFLSYTKLYRTLLYSTVLHCQWMHKEGRMERQSAVEQSSRPLHLHRRIIRMHPTWNYSSRGKWDCIYLSVRVSVCLRAWHHSFPASLLNYLTPALISLRLPCPNSYSPLPCSLPLSHPCSAPPLTNSCSALTPALLFLVMSCWQALGVLKEKAVIFHGWAEDSQREGEEL